MFDKYICKPTVTLFQAISNFLVEYSNKHVKKNCHKKLLYKIVLKTRFFQSKS